MSLNLDPVEVVIPESHYVFIQTTGDFMTNAPKAWQDLNSNLGLLSKVSFQDFMSLYKVIPERVYRAGVTVTEKPENLPDTFSYCLFEGGKYLKFTLVGSYAQLCDACDKALEKMRTLNYQTRDGYFIENYVSDPKTTNETDLITEIMIPIA